MAFSNVFASMHKTGETFSENFSDHSFAPKTFEAESAGKQSHSKTILMFHSKTNSPVSIFSRLSIYILGVFFLGYGIVLCVKCEMGVSPINSIPYVISHFIPLTLGTLSLFFYLVNILFQLLISPRKCYSGILLQLPISLIFGLVIDLWDSLIPACETFFGRCTFLCGSLFFTALGIMLIVNARLVPDPPTGTVQAISRATKKNLGTVKIVYDISCVGISLLISVLFAHRNIGFGFATLASALCVGRILAILQKSAQRLAHRYIPKSET